MISYNSLDSQPYAAAQDVALSILMTCQAALLLSYPMTLVSIRVAHLSPRFRSNSNRCSRWSQESHSVLLFEQVDIRVYSFDAPDCWHFAVSRVLVDDLECSYLRI